MKKTLYLYLFFVSLNLFSQTGLITYKATPDFKKNKGSYKINQEVKLMSFTLKYNRNNSFFKREKNMPINKFQSDLASILIRSNTNWFQNSKDKKSFYIKELKNKSYWVNHNFKMRGWKLVEGVKIIDGYTCYKATRKEFNNRAGIDVFFTAWYTPEIPMPYGPIGNGGLPGLILQLHKHKAVVYTVDKILLNSKQNKVKQPSKGSEISIKEFIKLNREVRKYTKE